jgi:hypothetical protein
VNPITPAPSRPARWLAAVALTLAGAVVGAFAGRWSASSGAIGREPVAPSHELGPDTSGLQELRYSIDDLARALRERPSGVTPATFHSDSISPERQPALPDLAGLDRLANAVERLDELLRAGPVRSETASGAQRRTSGAPMGPGYPSLEAMRSRVVSIRSAHPDEFNDIVAQEFSSAHVLWTREDVIARYGLPIRTDPQGDHGGLSLIYPGLDDPDHWELYFSTRLEPGSLVTGAGLN